jgi:acyl-CoA thioester hydrolase
VKRYTPEEINSGFTFSVPIQIRFSDIDSYMHVNNGIYFQYFEHARAAFLLEVCQWDIFNTGTVVANISIDYQVPLHIGDEVSAYIRCTHVGNTSFVLEQVLMGASADQAKKIYARAVTTMVAVDMKSMKPVNVPGEYRAKLQK